MPGDCSIGGCGDCPLAMTVTEAVGLAGRCGVEDGDVCMRLQS